MTYALFRLSSGEYRVGRECYFPTEDIQEDSDPAPCSEGYVHLGQ